MQKLQYCTPNTTAHPWIVDNFTTFTTTGASPKRYSYISFTFSDPNVGISVECGRTVPSGSVVDPDEFYECGGSMIQYEYYGDGVTVQEEVQCGK